MSTCSGYDFSAIITVADTSTVLAQKLAVMKTRAIAELKIHEEIDLAGVARK